MFQILVLNRRRDVILLLESIVGWGNVKADRISREKVVKMWRNKMNFALLRGILHVWESEIVHVTRQRHAAMIICRRKAANLISSVYRRWLNWSFTSRIDRHLKIQIRKKLVRRTDDIEISLREELPARCRSQKDFLIRILNRVFTKLSRNILRRWSMALTIRKKKQFANARAAKRSRVRTCAVVIDAWSSFVDRSFLLHQMRRKIGNRHNHFVMKNVVLLWKDCTRKMRRLRGRLRRLQRRMITRGRKNTFLLWRMLSEETREERIMFSRVVRSGRLDVLGG
mmetsp:Transcript_22167/g.72979  ORF Transcript_22167/g.72979 Transcript_22167/m.72979 type:complete len:283 (+) Transcript_22167:185-1033(+)